VDAFFGNPLTSVTIPGSVTFIGAYAFGSIEDYGVDQLTITIGANVSLATGKNEYSFSNSFDKFYNRNGKKAGTYTKNGRRWSYQP
jgi:hypothetical protein